MHIHLNTAIVASIAYDMNQYGNHLLDYTRLNVLWDMYDYDAWSRLQTSSAILEEGKKRSDSST